MASASAYIPPAFVFQMSWGADTGGFQEVSGLRQRAEVADIRQGGENPFVHNLPKPVKHGNVTLKRGLLPKDSACFPEHDLSERVVLHPLLITLTSEDGAPMMRWRLENAWPVRFDIGACPAQDGVVAVDTLEFAYTTITRDPD